MNSRLYPNIIYADYDTTIVTDRYLVADTLNVGHGKPYFSECVVKELIDSLDECAGLVAGESDYKSGPYHKTYCEAAEGAYKLINKIKEMTDD